MRADRRRAVVVLAALAVLATAGCATPAKDLAPDRPSASAAAVPQDGADVGFQPNLWLLDGLRPPSVRVSGGAEPSILADRQGRALWIGDTSGSYVSTDGGASWRPTGHYLADIGLAFGDGVALAQDVTGRLYAGVLNDNRVDVVASDDLGSTWSTMGLFAGVSGTADRPWLAADQDGEVVLFYFDAPFVATGLYEHCARSTDGGQSFLDRDPTAINPPTGGSAFFDSKGRFYFASNDGGLYRYDSTCLGGSTRLPMLDQLGVNNMLQGTADGTDLYMVGADPGGAIVLAGSHDGGPVQRITVSPAELATNTYATVSARNGTVVVAWYGTETKDDPSAAGFSGAFNVYVAAVQGFWTGTPAIAYTRVTAEPNHVGDICMGGIGCTSGDRDLLDYFMVAQDVHGDAHVAYVHDGSGSSTEVRHAFVAVAPPAPADGEADPGPAPAPTTSATGTPAPAPGPRPTPTPENHPPRPDFKVDPASPVEGQAVTLADASRDDDGKVVRLAWSVDGHSYSGTQVRLQLAAGTHRATLTATDDDGASASVTKDVAVAAAPAPAGAASAPVDRGHVPGPGPLAVAAALAMAFLARRRQAP